MKVLITGTHLTPALAVIEELKAYPDIDIVYIGRKYTIEGDRAPSAESQILPSLGVKFIHLVAGRLRRFLSWGTLTSLAKVPVGFIQAFYLVAYERPQVVLSFGGYIGLPVVVAGWLLSIPIIVHEQTLVSGLANKISAFFANKIAVSFDPDLIGIRFNRIGVDHSYPFDKNKIVLTGNPLRQEILYPQKLTKDYQQIVAVAKENNLPVILVTGGNQGSHVINVTVEQCLDQLLKMACLVHQTGDSSFSDYERLAKKETDRYLVKKFIGLRIGAVMKNVDLVICRSGANTLLELAYFRVPAITIPLPYLYQNEQLTNARFYEQLGLCQVIPQSQLTANRLLDEVSQAIKHLPLLREKAKNAQDVVIKDAAKRLTQEVLKFLRYG